MEEEAADASDPETRKVLKKAIADYVATFEKFICAIGGGTWPPIDRSAF
jgi:hypothetical protein